MNLELRGAGATIGTALARAGAVLASNTITAIATYPDWGRLTFPGLWNKDKHDEPKRVTTKVHAPGRRNLDLPPLVVGEAIPDEYLTRAGFDLDFLYNRNLVPTEPVKLSPRCERYHNQARARLSQDQDQDQSENRTTLTPPPPALSSSHIIVPRACYTEPVCETSYASPLAQDIVHAANSIPQDKKGQLNSFGTFCTTMNTYGTAALGICGKGWNGHWWTLRPYFYGIAQNCTTDGMDDLAGGYQLLNEYGLAAIAKVIVFHS